MRLRTFVAASALALAAAVFASPALANGTGKVFAISNSPAGNVVLVYDRAADGSLTAAGTVASGGAGTGGGLGSQGAVVLSPNGKLLFAVNPGSDSISSFRVRPDGVELVDTEPSGGDLPTSVTYRDGLVYALNAGAPNSISGFAVDHRGRLSPLFGSTRPLSAAQTAPAQVEFTPDGSALVVTERATNLITTYVVGAGGVPGPAASYPSGGATPFGFAFTKRGTLVVSDATGASGASSYALGADGAVSAITPLLATGQRAACWTVVTNNGRFAYVTNAQTSNISGFAISKLGALSLLSPDGITTTTSGGPTDAAFSRNDAYLYVRIGSRNAIDVFALANDGSLSPLPGIDGLPAGAAGLAAS
jgi:6-phosphogluconolactonase (cycloisomerase 2 family)